MDNVLCKATSRLVVQSVSHPGRQWVNQPAGQSVNTFWFLLSGRISCLSSPPITPGHTQTNTQTYTHASTCKKRHKHKTVKWLLLSHFGFKQAAALSLKPHVLFNRCFSSEYQMGHLQSPGVAPTPMYSVM